jgi:RNA polymerase sigma-70 factor (ECF subfamily)
MDIKTKSVCDQKTYEQIFNTHSETLRNFVYYKCGDIQQAEDIVQNAFVKLWNNCSKIVFEKAKSFLYTVSRNEFLNEVAHKKIVLQHQVHLAKSSTNESPEFLLEEKEFMLKLKTVIADLPEKQREVFLLSRIDKKKYSEISEIIGISVKAVEKRMSQALITLRARIGNI